MQRGFSMIGILITMACIVVLFAIMMNSVNKSVTGQGTQQSGTVRSFQDELYLKAIFDSMMVHSLENKGVYIVPSDVSGSKDISQNTTANLYSVMLMQNYTVPKQLISGNEYSGYVEECTDYNFEAFDPNVRSYWDSNFKADLKKVSNVSFAHMPFFGDRFDKQWRSTMNSMYPLLGNRGPQDAVNSVNSYACGRDGIWRGHVVFGDGHIQFVENPLIAGLSVKQDGKSEPDNLFKMESGPNGLDAIFSFTKIMTKKGPELQFD